MRDAFGLFRGWCRSATSCLEYTPTSVPTGAAEIAPLRCARCRCLPQEHVAAREEGYDPHSEEQLRERRKYDERLLEPDARSALHKERADAAFNDEPLRRIKEEIERAKREARAEHIKGVFGPDCGIDFNSI